MVSQSNNVYELQIPEDEGECHHHPEVLPNACPEETVPEHAGWLHEAAGTDPLKGCVPPIQAPTWPHHLPSGVAHLGLIHVRIEIGRKRENDDC